MENFVIAEGLTTQDYKSLLSGFLGLLFSIIAKCLKIVRSRGELILNFILSSPIIPIPSKRKWVMFYNQSCAFEDLKMYINVNFNWDKKVENVCNHETLCELSMYIHVLLLTAKANRHHSGSKPIFLFPIDWIL